jgi:hypothetical protein
VRARNFLPSKVCWIIAVSLLPAASAYANYTVTGRFLYEDREFDMRGFTGTVTKRPIRFADVRIVADGVTLATGATGQDGSFSIPVSSSSAQPITALCITGSNMTPGLLFNLRVANNDYSFGDLYSLATTPATATGSGVLDMGTTTALSTEDPGKFFNIWDVVIDAMQFVASPQANGSLPTKSLTVLWRSNHPDTGSFFAGARTNAYLFVGSTAAYDDTVISHEFGHFITYLYSNSDSPGGQHFIGDNNQDMRLAWDEGLATFLGSSARKFHGYSRPEIYVDTDGEALSFSLELEYLTGNSVFPGSISGSTNEIAVGAALWDITDGADTADSTPGTDDDPLQRPFSDVWKDLTRYFPSVTLPGITVETFWNGWFAPGIDNGFLKDMQEVFADVNGIEFRPDAQEPDDSPFLAPTVTTPLVPGVQAGAPRVVINELEMGLVDAVELYNKGDVEADITNWVMEATSQVNGSPSRASWRIPPFKLSAGGFVILSEASGLNTNATLYFSRDIHPENNIPWANGYPGSCLIRDSGGRPVDFVRWGGSAEPVPAGTSFAAPDPDAPPPGKTLGRDFYGTDTDSGTDWTPQVSTFGTYNISGAEKKHTYYPAGDVDHAAFAVSAGRSYLVETLDLANGADTIIDILAVDGQTVLASNDDYGTWKSSRLQWTAPSSGNYYIRSHRFNGPSNYAQYGSSELRVMESTTRFGLPLPETLTVSRPGQGGKFGSISDAVAAASNGDTILVLDSATYVENPVIANLSVTLRASAGKSPVLDGRINPGVPALSVFSAKSVRIEGMTIVGGAQGIQVNGGNVTVLNSVINGASDPGGTSDGILIIGRSSQAEIVNCTIVNSGRYGVELQSANSVKVANSMFRNNAAGDIDPSGSAGQLVVRNSLLGTPAFVGMNGNINGDPYFVDAGHGNFRLLEGSAAIDRGDPTDPDLPALDADGILRSLDGTGTGRPLPDIGAYEYLPPGLLSSTAVFPQIVVGGNPAYRTSIVALNTRALPATASLSLLNSSAGAFPAGAGVADPWLSIMPSGATDRTTGGSTQLTAGYATLSSNVPIGGHALFQTMTGNRILSEAAVGLSIPTMGFTAYIDNTGNAYSGYAVANFGAKAANLTLALREASGTLRGTQALSLPPGHHVAEFALQRFPAATAGFEGTLEVSSDVKVAAVALRYDNPEQNVFSTLPVLGNEAATTLYFPQVADGGGYRTNLILINTSATATTASLDFFADDGSRLALPIGGTEKTSYTLTLGAKGIARLTTDGTSQGIRVGWVRVVSSAALGGSAILQTVSGARIKAEAGVSSSAPAYQFTTYVDSLDFAASGLAICNPNSIGTTVTLKLRNSVGETLATKAFVLPPFGHIAQFFSGPGQLFPEGFDRFQGTLEVVATGAVSAVALRYDNFEADVFASLPVVNH